MGSNSCSSPRRKAAKEAAHLLYFGFEKEYKQAKMKAAETLGTSFLPTNIEVAIEFDRIAEKNEGVARKKRLILMRKEALKLMKVLKRYNPILIGSVWRGTIHRESDIDIIVYHNYPKDISELLREKSFKIQHTERVTVTKEGQKRTALHLHIATSTEEKAEVIVRSLEESARKEKCEIFGDIITGLSIQELENVLANNPTQRFTPPRLN